MKRIINKTSLVLLLVGLLTVPSFTFAQEQQPELGVSQEEMSTRSTSREIEATPSTDLRSNPWENSSSASAEQEDDNNPSRNNASARPSASNQSSGGGGGSTVTGGRDPGGNPDVPFDTNMNIMFLIGSLVFAFVVYKKQFKLKAVEVKK